MTDQIIIEGLRLETVIGVYDWERTIRQALVLDLRMATDIRPAAATDDLRKTLDYKAISDRIADFVEGTQHQLVETLAEQIAGLMMTEFGVAGLTLKLSKPGALPRAANVAVFIARGCPL